MNARLPSHPLAVLAITLLLACTAGCRHLADPGVVVSSFASVEYTKTKYAEKIPKRETYVFMPGHFFGGVTVDTSLTRMTFRELAEQLAPELARQQYFPAQDLGSADLLVIVHWGVTSPRSSIDEIRAHPGPHLDVNPSMTTHTVMSELDPENPHNETVLMKGSDETVANLFSNLGTEADMDVGFDQLEREIDLITGQFTDANSIKLLGYSRQLRELGNRPMVSTTEGTLRSDLNTERYFVVLRAYDLKHKVNRKPSVVWTLHLNTRSPGHSFRQSLGMMATASVNYFGRDVEEIKTVIPKIREGRIEYGELKIVGERN